MVSGIGFLGAGIIYRDGFSVQGLNTAATLWCSAAIGVMAGSGAWHLAFLMTGFVVFVNLGLRPLVKLLKHHTGDAAQERTVHVALSCRNEQEGACRQHILSAFSKLPLRLSSMASTNPDDSSRSKIEATFVGVLSGQSGVDAAIAALAADPHHLDLTWRFEEEA